MPSSLFEASITFFRWNEKLREIQILHVTITYT